MSWNVNVLVVANRTAHSPELLNALRARAARSPSVFTLVLPVAPDSARKQASIEERNAQADPAR